MSNDPPPFFSEKVDQDTDVMNSRQVMYTSQSVSLTLTLIVHKATNQRAFRLVTIFDVVEDRCINDLTVNFFISLLYKITSCRASVQ